MPRDCEAATPEEIAGNFAYDPETGVIYRLGSKRADTIGAIPRISHSNGYLIVWGMGRLFRAHRLAWVLMTGEWPEADVDHINGNRADNRWANLRAASRSQNLRNAKTRSNSSTAVKGVEARGKRFIAYIRLDGKKKHLGVFDTADLAHAAYCQSAKAHFGEFASNGERA